jgi:hypothetical protein
MHDSQQQGINIHISTAMSSFLFIFSFRVKNRILCFPQQFACLCVTSNKRVRSKNLFKIIKLWYRFKPTKIPAFYGTCPLNIGKHACPVRVHRLATSDKPIDLRSHAIYGMEYLRPLEHWESGFESHSRHGCMPANLLSVGRHIATPYPHLCSPTNYL